MGIGAPPEPTDAEFPPKQAIAILGEANHVHVPTFVPISGKCPEGEDFECSSTTNKKPVSDDPQRFHTAQDISIFGDLNLETRSSLCLGDWNALPSEVQDMVLARLPSFDILKGRSVCRSFRDVIKRKVFQQARGRLGRREYLSPLVFYVKDGLWRILGLDYKEKIWRMLPPFEGPIPEPEVKHIDLFKDFLVSGHRGLFCVSVGKPPEEEKIFVCNPFTGLTQQLPPLEFSRHPVVLHLHVRLHKSEYVVTSSYQVIAVGSSTTETESLSRKTEVYDSVTERWEPAADVSEWEHSSLEDHQTGVYCESENLLLCVGTVNGSEAIVPFDVQKREWREYWPLFPQNPAPTILFAQLVECSGVVYLFSEQEAGEDVTHCIDRLELVSGGLGFTPARKVTRLRQSNKDRSKNLCVPLGENKLCIFDPCFLKGIVYNMSDDPINPDTSETIPVAPRMDGVLFQSLNPVGFAFEPSFGV